VSLAVVGHPRPVRSRTGSRGPGTPARRAGRDRPTAVRGDCANASARPLPSSSRRWASRAAPADPHGV